VQNVKAATITFTDWAVMVRWTNNINSILSLNSVDTSTSTTDDRKYRSDDVLAHFPPFSPIALPAKFSTSKEWREPRRPCQIFSRISFPAISFRAGHAESCFPPYLSSHRIRLPLITSNWTNSNNSKLQPSIYAAGRHISS
jgi:hypothetical protein